MAAAMNHLFQLTAEGLLSSLIGQIVARVQKPIHRRTSPATADECFGKGGVGARHKVGHKRSPLLRL